ncbi:hypothetical protein C2S53_013865 [Perilla frutescens var. hirtella]|uniref:Uncharacterized protein n=1 Tax=Perilla frutescens var. hirtella TaxID=608512 RepID=A0AAD4J0J3_PERFH|nr:hypothetical protein C2S53_013865 [Perilla frutescens var. hirtella]
MGRSMKVVIVGLMAIIVASSIAECDATSRALGILSGIPLVGGLVDGIPLVGGLLGGGGGRGVLSILGGGGGVIGGILAPPTA